MRDIVLRGVASGRNPSRLIALDVMTSGVTICPSRRTGTAPMSSSSIFLARSSTGVSGELGRHGHTLSPAAAAVYEILMRDPEFQPPAPER